MLRTEPLAVSGRTELVAVLFTMAFAAGVWIVPTGPLAKRHETGDTGGAARAGSRRFELDRRIDGARHTTLTRERALALFSGRFLAMRRLKRSLGRARC